MKIIKIGAMWCPACIIMNKFWNKVKEEFKNIEFIDYDLDMDEEKIESYQVGNVLPVIIAINNGIEKSRLIGEKKEEEVLEFIRKNGDIE